MGSLGLGASGSVIICKSPFNHKINSTQYALLWILTFNSKMNIKGFHVITKAGSLRKIAPWQNTSITEMDYGGEYIKYYNNLLVSVSIIQSFLICIIDIET